MRTVTIILPEGYKDQDEFAKDCGFTLVATEADEPHKCAMVKSGWDHCISQCMLPNEYHAKPVSGGK